MAVLVSRSIRLADEIVAATDDNHRTTDETYKKYDYSKMLDQYVTCYRGTVDDFGLF